MVGDDARLRERLRALGRRVRLLRTWRELTQETLAARSGLSRGFLLRIESGQSTPDVAHLWALADALDVRAADLLGDGPLPPPPQ